MAWGARFDVQRRQRSAHRHECRARRRDAARL